jgi:hypothetical protein
MKFHEDQANATSNSGSAQPGPSDTMTRTTRSAKIQASAFRRGRRASADGDDRQQERHDAGVHGGRRRG